MYAGQLEQQGSFSFFVDQLYFLMLCKYFACLFMLYLYEIHCFVTENCAMTFPPIIIKQPNF